MQPDSTIIMPLQLAAMEEIIRFLVAKLEFSFEVNADSLTKPNRLLGMIMPSKLHDGVGTGYDFGMIRKNLDNKLLILQ